MDDYYRHFRSTRQVQAGFSELEMPWVAAAHLSLLLGILFPFVGAVIGPLTLICVRGGHMRGLEAEATEALNFGVTFSICYTAAEFIGLATGQVHSLLGIYWLQMALGPYFVVSVLLAYRCTRAGSPYRYRLTLRLIGHPVPRPHPYHPEARK